MGKKEGVPSKALGLGLLLGSACIEICAVESVLLRAAKSQMQALQNTFPLD